MQLRWWVRKRLEAQLAEAIRRFNTTVCAGHSLNAALHQLAAHSQAPLGPLLTQVLTQHQAGDPLPQALRRLFRYSHCEEMELFITTLCVGLESGGSVHQLLNHAEEIALNKKALKEKMQALTAQGRLQGFVTAGLPIALFVALQFVNPGYTAPLTDTPLGRTILVGSLIINLLGLVWIQSLSRPKL